MLLVQVHRVTSSGWTIQRVPNVIPPIIPFFQIIMRIHTHRLFTRAQLLFITWRLISRFWRTYFPVFFGRYCKAQHTRTLICSATFTTSHTCLPTHVVPLSPFHPQPFSHSPSQSPTHTQVSRNCNNSCLQRWRQRCGWVKSRLQMLLVMLPRPKVCVSFVCNSMCLCHGWK